MVVFVGFAGRYKVTLGSAEHWVEIRIRPEEVFATIDGEPFEGDVVRTPDGIHVRDGGRCHDFAIETGREKLSLSWSGKRVCAEVHSLSRRRESTTRAASSGASDLRAPMPGRVLVIRAKNGDHVKAGDALMVIEAMKMENELRAPRDVVIDSVEVVEGASVEGGAVLLRFR